MISISAYSPKYKDDVLSLKIKSTQEDYVEPLSQTLEQNLSRENFIILLENQVIGFFQVDSSSGLQCVEGSLELHEVIIDKRCQGQGLGKDFITLLPTFIRTKYPNAEFLCLTVNLRNKLAKHIYEFGGFIDTGKIKYEGRSGPQHIMSLRL